MTNVVDEVLNTAQTDNKVKYTLTRDNGTTENVQIDLLTPVVKQGTPLNKVLFDSIKDDLNTRLLISNKATQAEAETGTNDTKYMTPLKTKQEIAVNKVVEYKFSMADLVTEGTGNQQVKVIPISTYLTSDTYKLEIYVNGFYRLEQVGYNLPITVVGTKMLQRSIATGDTSTATNTSSSINITSSSAKSSLRFKAEILNNSKELWIEGAQMPRSRLKQYI